MYRLNQIKLNINHSDSDFKNKIAKLLKVSVDDIDWSTLIILHKSIDARDKSNILFVYNVAFDFASDMANESNHHKGDKKVVGFNHMSLEVYNPVKFNPYVIKDNVVAVGNDILSSQVRIREMSPKIVGASTVSPYLPRPVVVGFGPAGIFASYIFALNGLKPIIIERGKALEDRIKDVDKFFETMELDEKSNVCFGEGGAGAFSDGKLNTNNKDKTGIYHFVLETFVKFGADEKILYENMPHIGTDKLVGVIKNIRNEIIKLGGEIHYNTKWTYKTGSHSSPVQAEDAPVVLAIGNSSRDTFRELIENGFDIKAKPIAVGYRIAHRQNIINEAQYGRAANQNDVKKVLGAATYKLTYDVGNGHSVYSFCMCPGGYIINSSNYRGLLSINGMSYNDRSGEYANSAIVETVRPEDITYNNLQTNNPSMEALKMIEFQEKVERTAFELEKGFIPYISNTNDDICEEKIFKGKAKYNEKLKSVYENSGLKFDINKDIEEALQYFNRIIKGFYSDSQYIMAGVETRTSSPVKLDRDENFMCNVKNFYPCGEGLGHGGGILSCAADGVKVALKICENSR